MTRIELQNKLIDRVGWKQPTGSAYTLSADNKLSESGRYFQDEHSFVTLDRLHAIMEEVNADNTNFNEYLKTLRENVVLMVIDEVFLDAQFNPVELERNPSLFDPAISKRMTMKVAELLFSSTRTNLIERFSKDSMNTFYFDVNGDQNFKDKISITVMFQKEVDRLKDLFNTEIAIDTVTMAGGVKNWYESY